MTDAAWAQGMTTLLSVGLAGWPSDPREADVRARAYREALDDLTDPEWLYAASEAVRYEPEYFPKPGRLREYAEQYSPSIPEHRLLPRFAGNGWEDVDTARKGLAMIREAVKERTGMDLGEAVKSMPK